MIKTTTTTTIKIKLKITKLLLIFPSLLTAITYADEGAGKALYNRCSACHLPSGAGISGAFPPLKGHFSTLSQTDLGRAYIVLAVKYGLSGGITVKGQRYFGVMPAQADGWDNQQLAEVLNYINQEIDSFDSKVKPFSSESIAAIIEQYSTVNNAQLVYQLRQKLVQQQLNIE